MQAVYGERPLTSEEVAHLSAFLQTSAQAAGVARSRPLPFPAFGLGGVLILFGLAAAIWRGRLRGVREPLIGGRG